MKNLLLALIPFLLIGCASVEIEENKTLRYHGHYNVGFEVNEFKPCGIDEMWWIGAWPEEEKIEFGASPEYLEVFGTVTPRGRYGHLGAYKREIHIHKIIVRDIPRKDCNQPENK